MRDNIQICVTIGQINQWAFISFQQRVPWLKVTNRCLTFEKHPVTLDGDHEIIICGYLGVAKLLGVDAISKTMTNLL